MPARANITTCFDSKRPVIGRFAPSPTGRMHAGNIYAALLTWLMVKSQDGAIVLRIEDLDRARSRTEYADLVQRDFDFLGLTWDKGPFFQHNRDEAYEKAYEALDSQGLIYPCFCTRADLKAASAPHEQDKWVYAGTCRGLDPLAIETRWEECKKQGRPGPAYRLKVPISAEALRIDDCIQGSYSQNLATDCGDFVIRRADGDFAYQLAVVLDDAEQGVTFVSRGIDLLSSSPQQAYLQELLGLPKVAYAHFPLLCAADGRRLAKRDKDACIDQLIETYKTPEGVLGHISFVAGLIDKEEPVTAYELLQSFDMSRLTRFYQEKQSILYF